MANTTMLASLINPEVMGDMISAELPAALRALGFMKVDTALQGRAGNTITIPQYGYIGRAEDTAEGAEGVISELTTSEKEYTVKKVTKNVELTDEAALSGYGDPMGELTNQLRLSIQDKMNADGTVQLTALTAGVTETTKPLSYELVVEALDILPTEEQGDELYLLVSKAGIKQLRLDEKFITKDNGVVLGTGVVGTVAGAKVIISKAIADGIAFLMKPQSLTAFMKRNVTLETSRDVLRKVTLFSADAHYVTAIEDTTKIVKIMHKAGE